MARAAHWLSSSLNNDRYNRTPDDIVLYGQSVGSGPSVDLASRTRGLAGCVLHSPLMSGTP